MNIRPMHKTKSHSRKLDAHGETAFERPANARYEATLAAMLNAHGEAVYERLIIRGELHSNEFNCKALHAKLASRRSYKKSRG